jgi:hypothetical protein
MIAAAAAAVAVAVAFPFAFAFVFFAYSLDSNLAVVIKSDGSLIGMGRSALYKAVNWRDPTTYSFHPTQGAGGEVSLSNNEFRSENTTWMDAFVRAMLPAETALCAAAWHSLCVAAAGPFHLLRQPHAAGAAHAAPYRTRHTADQAECNARQWVLYQSQIDLNSLLD